jgi:hypothetical protein
VKDGGWYRTGLLAYGVEALPGTSAQQAVLDRFLDWCDGLALADGDGDGTANGADCVPSNPSVWAAPSVTLDLLLSGGAATSLAWSAPAAAGAVTVVYDTLRSASAQSFAAATCLETDQADTGASDGALPAAGAAFHYLVRVENGCGSNMGAGSDGIPHAGPACP